MSAPWFDPMETFRPDDFGIEIPDDGGYDFSEPCPCNGTRPHCLNCGCCEFRPCPGGCVWATPTLCSRCV